MYSVSFSKHTLECRVIVFGVREKPFVGGERRRVQELYVGLDSSLLEVVGVWAHNLCGGRSRQTSPDSLCAEVRSRLSTELQVQAEVEGVRQEVREVKGESKVEERRSLHEHVDDMDDKHKTHDLSHGELCARCDEVC